MHDPMTLLEAHWQWWKETMEDHPCDAAGFQACDRFYGWLDGYAACLTEFDHFEEADEVRWLQKVAISMAYLYRLEGVAA